MLFDSTSSAKFIVLYKNNTYFFLSRRLERQVEVEREERMVLQRTNQELSAGIAERSSAEVRSARAAAAALQAERDALKDDMRRLETRIEQLQADCKRAVADADTARSQQQHYKVGWQIFFVCVL